MAARESSKEKDLPLGSCRVRGRARAREAPTEFALRAYARARGTRRKMLRERLVHMPARLLCVANNGSKTPPNGPSSMAGSPRALLQGERATANAPPAIAIR